MSPVGIGFFSLKLWFQISPVICLVIGTLMILGYELIVFFGDNALKDYINLNRIWKTTNSKASI